MTSNITIHDETIKKLDEKLEHCIELETTVMKTDEYKELFKKAKQAYPDEYDYIVHMACISYFEDKTKIDEP